jgi:hypothetical protein
MELKMKTIRNKVIYILTLIIFLGGCTKNFDEINTDPNNPENVSTGYIFTYAEKNIMDNLRDEWAGGRMFFLLSQYWSQKNYTDEDRYAFRSSVIDNWWRAMYPTAMNLDRIIQLNTDEETKNDALASGANENQIAAAMILKVYIFSVLTDAFGDVPYSESFLGNENRQPAYDRQEIIYPDLIAQLKDAVGMINLDKNGILFGDIIYGGDMMKWKKFGASLALRLAQRMEKRDGGAALADIVSTYGNDGFFTSNEDNAKFAYVGAGDDGPLYTAWFTDNRDDFTLAKPFTLILKGENDDLNGKTNPFEGLMDPRIYIYAPGDYEEIIGMPYGMPDDLTQGYSDNCPNFKNNPSVVNSATYAYPFMDYAEVCFILSEYNGWDQTWYEKGVRASMEDWGVDGADIDAFVAAMPAASEATVLTQKYVALYLQGEQGWFEYRRTGYPKMLVQPGEITHVDSEGNNVIFEPLEGNGTAIPRKIPFPVEEYNINSTSVEAAVQAMGGDGLDVRVWWDMP